MNIEDEEMNLLPAGTKMELIRIMRIRDVKKLTDIGVKGNSKIFKVDKTFLKHNVSHLLCPGTKLQSASDPASNTLEGTFCKHPGALARQVCCLHTLLNFH